MLAGVPLFAGLSRRQLRRVASAAEEVGYNAGAVIFLQDDSAVHLYVIVEGTVRVFRGFTPSARAIKRFGPGEFFGDLAVLNGGRRTASALAETAVTCIRVSRTNLDRLLKKEPDIAVRVVHTLAERMAQVVREVVH
jgi:CRP/FNR family cyclic AMP-dependent transcriptional regulator